MIGSRTKRDGLLASLMEQGPGVVELVCAVLDSYIASEQDVIEHSSEPTEIFRTQGRIGLARDIKHRLKQE